MKKILSILSVFAILFTTHTFAQDQATTNHLPTTKVKVYDIAHFFNSPEHDAQEMTNRLSKQLSLNFQQESTVYQISLQTAEKRLALNNLLLQDQEAFASTVLNIYKERDTAIENVLTSKQKLQYKEIKARLMSQRVDAE